MMPSWLRCRAISTLLAGEEDIEVVATAAAGAEAV